MHPLIICLAVMSAGDDYGWERMPDDGMQYIIQIDPRKLDALRDGIPIESDVPPSAGNVRSYRIVVGRNKLPHDTPPVALPPDSPPASLPAPEAARPLGEQRTAFKEPKGAIDKPAAPPADTGPIDTGASETPWLPLTFSLLGLFASLGGNVFLGWIAWDARRSRRREYGSERSRQIAGG